MRVNLFAYAEKDQPCLGSTSPVSSVNKPNVPVVAAIGETLGLAVEPALPACPCGSGSAAAGIASSSGTIFDEAVDVESFGWSGADVSGCVAGLDRGPAELGKAGAALSLPAAAASVAAGEMADIALNNRTAQTIPKHALTRMLPPESYESNGPCAL